MAQRRRYLVAPDVQASRRAEFAAIQQERFAACPEAAQFTDEEVSDFLSAAQYLDAADQKTTVAILHRARIAFPPELAFDEYRLGRHLLHRWREPEFRDAFLGNAMHLDYRLLAQIKRRRDIEALLDFADHDGPPAALSVLRNHGMADLIPALLEAFSPQQAARYQALLLYGKLVMHRFLTEPEPPGQPSQWEQRKLIRRIRLRDVQLRSMRRSLHTLRRERKSLLALLPVKGRRDQSELDALASELAQIRVVRAEAERRHTAALAQQAQRHQEAVVLLQQQLAAASQDYSDTLAVRKAWLPVTWRW